MVARLRHEAAARQTLLAELQRTRARKVQNHQNDSSAASWKHIIMRIEKLTLRQTLLVELLCVRARKVL